MNKKTKKKILKSEKITFWKVKKVQKSPSITFSITFEKVIKSPFHFQLSLSLTEGESERWKVFFFAFLCMHASKNLPNKQNKWANFFETLLCNVIREFDIHSLNSYTFCANKILITNLQSTVFNTKLKICSCL